MAYIRREVGTVSRPLLRLASQIFLLAHQRHVQILPVFVSSEGNLLAASHFQTLPDWSLPIEIFRRVVHRWTLPEIDLFATTASALTLRFFAWGDAPGCTGCTRSAMELSPGLRVSSSPSSHSEDLGLLRHLPPSDALLARPEVVPGGPGPPGHG